MRFTPNQPVTVQFSPVGTRRTAIVQYLRDDLYERNQWEQWNAATNNLTSPYYYSIQYDDDGSVDTYVNQVYLEPLHPGTTRTP
jgi:hypothetical protein